MITIDLNESPSLKPILKAPKKVMFDVSEQSSVVQESALEELELIDNLYVEIQNLMQ